MDHHVPWQIESKGFEDCCVLVGPRKGRKYTTNPEYEFYAKYHAPNTEDSCDTQADTIESKIAVRGAYPCRDGSHSISEGYDKLL